VIVSAGADIQRCVIMDNCKIGANAVLKDVILDKNVIVPDGVEIGVDPDYDRERGFTVSKGGVTVLGKGQFIEPKRAVEEAVVDAPEAEVDEEKAEVAE